MHFCKKSCCIVLRRLLYSSQHPGLRQRIWAGVHRFSKNVIARSKCYAPARVTLKTHLGRLIVEDFLDDNQTHAHSLGLLWTSDQPVADASTYTTYDKMKRNTRIPSADFELGDPSNRATADRTTTCIGLAWYYWHFDQHIFLEICDTRTICARIILRHILKSELFGANIRTLWKHLHEQDNSDSLVISLVVRFIGKGRVIFQLPYFTPLCYLD